MAQIVTFFTQLAAVSENKHMQSHSLNPPGTKTQSDGTNNTHIMIAGRTLFEEVTIGRQDRCMLRVSAFPGQSHRGTGLGTMGLMQR